MKLQLLSDLHLETETFDPEPAPGAELLVLAGDVDSTWAGYERFAGWPVPVVVVAGNHEFDGRELSDAWPALREHCARFGLRLLQRESLVFTASGGQRVRILGLACRAWLETELGHVSRKTWDKTIVVTHFAPSLMSADPRYGRQPGTASFCNADDDLIPRADLWLHGHLHCRHDYALPRAGQAPVRVVCNARGLAAKGEDLGHAPQLTLEV